MGWFLLFQLPYHRYQWCGISRLLCCRSHLQYCLRQLWHRYIYRKLRDWSHCQHPPVVERATRLPIIPYLDRCPCRLDPIGVDPLRLWDFNLPFLVLQSSYHQALYWRLMENLNHFCNGWINHVVLCHMLHYCFCDRNPIISHDTVTFVTSYWMW